MLWTARRISKSFRGGGGSVVELPECCFGTLAIPFIPVCQHLSEETLKAFYLVYICQGKYPTQGVNVNYF